MDCCAIMPGATSATPAGKPRGVLCNNLSVLSAGCLPFDVGPRECESCRLVFTAANNKEFVSQLVLIADLVA